MKDNEIIEAAERIEKAISAEVAIARFRQHGGGPDDSYIVANRAGYLRLAALFLRAAVAPHKVEGSALIDIDSSDILDEDSDVGINWLERQETFEQDEYNETLADKFSFVGCAVCWLALFALLVVGIVTVIGWVVK